MSSDLFASGTLLALGNVSWSLFTWGLSGGIASFFSPCALPMLPASLSYYLSAESISPAGSDAGTDLGTGGGHSVTIGLRRGVLFGGLASLGMLSVFAVTAAVAGLLGDILTQVIPVLIPLVGGIVLSLGVLMLADRASFLSRSVPLPEWGDASPKQSFSFGLLFAGAALGCTAPVFFGITLTALSTGGIAGAVTVLTGYASGMIGLFVVMTALVAVAKEETARRIQSLVPYIERASALLLIGAGLYMLYYYVQIQSL
jgi:cytochrome c-type biogenesis protein